MAIVVDAMGGDFAPTEVVQGAGLAAPELDQDLILVGRQAEIEKVGVSHPRIRIHHTDDVVEMGEHPAQALKKKPKNSISVGMQLARETPGSAFVSAGSTGACMAAALFVMKRLPGVERPPIAGVMPSLKGACVVADVGANVDCKPSQVGQFAVMASAYARFLFKIDEPRVGLLNIGTEPAKGNEAAQSYFELLSKQPGIKFVGNVEPEHVFHGDVDAVVTDGYPGNIFLKSSEAVANVFHTILKEELGKLAAAAGPDMAKKVGGGLKERLGRFSTSRPDLAGAPLLGVNGTVIIVHGAARAETVKNAILVGARVAGSGYLDHLRAIFKD